MFLTQVLDEKKSVVNGNIRVLKTLGMGIYIQANGLTQSGGIVETIWKQTIRKINQNTCIKKCLILGLGGGTVAKLIKSKWKDSSIDGIDIDPVMVDFGKKYLGLDPKIVKIEIGDVSEKINKINCKYNLVVVDIYQGDVFPEIFEKAEFINRIKSILNKGGIAIFNRLYYGDKRPRAVKFGQKLEKIFSTVTWFYPEANLMFICSK